VELLAVTVADATKRLSDLVIVHDQIPVTLMLLDVGGLPTTGRANY
jgi:hypothetical protein